MKILYLNNGLAGGGIEKLLNDLLPLMKVDHQCELLILSDENEKYLHNLQENGIKVIVIPHEEKGYISRTRYIYNYIKSNVFDIVHVNGFPTFYLCALVRLFLGKKCPPIVMTEHNTDNRRRHIKLARVIEKCVYRYFTRIVSISEQTQIALIKWLMPRNTDKFCVIENGIDTKHFFEASNYERREIFPKVGNGDIILCMIGTFTEQKNHDFIIRVLETLPTRYKLVLLGEGPLKEKVIELVNEKKLNDRVEFLGFRSDVAEVIKTSDIMVIPSKWEGFGLISVEGMACGKPIVAANVPGLAEVIGDVGILAPNDDEKKFGTAIIMATSKIGDVDLVKKEQERARIFDINLMKEKYENVYRELQEDIKVKNGHKNKK